VILDVGCGTSKETDTIYFTEYKFCPIRAGPEATFLDISIPKLRIKNFIRGDAQNLPFRGNSFEEIYASHVLEHLDEPLKFLWDARRVLVRGGRLHVWVPNFTCREYDPSHKHVFNYYSLKSLFRDRGFRVFIRLPFVLVGFLPKKIGRLISALFTYEIYVEAIRN